MKNHAGMEWVRGHRWSGSKSGWRNGYWRPKRPKGRFHRFDKRPTRFSPKLIKRDKYGHILGYR